MAMAMAVAMASSIGDGVACVGVCLASSSACLTQRCSSFVKLKAAPWAPGNVPYKTLGSSKLDRKRSSRIMRRSPFFKCSADKSDRAGPALEDPPAIEQQLTVPDEEQSNGKQQGIMSWLYPNKEELPEDVEMSIFDHLEELRQRLFVSVAAVGVAILGCFAFSKDLIILLESPAYVQGVRFLQLSPGEYFFTTLKVPVIQLLLGQTRIVTGDQMLSVWRYVVVGAVIAAAVLTPSTDPLTQVLLAGPLIVLYLGGAFLVKAIQPQVDTSID
ncbi:hypothetical protein O6H91_11G031400 [Diphasiastrum complanatum]|uniref:Uncharacterized protein n=1 Tax=Diphasiastrum complanatum TaxID=34168 RepID=A0ACC2C7M3_DIPCM|nr:hypothetical protein O6H91_11G031400 [Diphasiastrum complanatum]